MIKMKKSFVIWLIVLLIPLALAATSTQTLKVDTPVVVNGKTITLTYVEANMIILEVDGLSGRYSLIGKIVNDTMIYSPNISLGGVFIRVFEIFERQNEIKSEIIVTFTCGNKRCESNETGFCCKDCNCTAGYSCVDNQCIDAALNECLNDSQCNDNKNCTVDSCSGIPRKCIHAIKACKDYDFCCPKGCTFDNDADCPNVNTSTALQNASQNATLSLEECNSSLTGRQGIVQNTSSYCSETGWRARKPDSSSCIKDYECINKCIKNKCFVMQEKKPVTTYVIAGAIILILILSLARYFILKRRTVIKSP